MEDKKLPILVTGSHRSGTTWVGQMLATSENIGYIWEPFNKGEYIGNMNIREIKYWFTYVDKNNNEEIIKIKHETSKIWPKFYSDNDW